MSPQATNAGRQRLHRDRYGPRRPRHSSRGGCFRKYHHSDEELAGLNMDDSLDGEMCLQDFCWPFAGDVTTILCSCRGTIGTLFVVGLASMVIIIAVASSPDAVNTLLLFITNTQQTWSRALPTMSISTPELPALLADLSPPQQPAPPPMGPSEPQKM